MMLINPYLFPLGYTPTDANAAAYIAAVEAADGSTLENGVRKAIDDFVIGCKADGIWTAIGSACILSGARTLSGALVPLKGAAPTSINFSQSDYNRKNGLKGNGTNTYLNSNRAGNADPLNDCHWATWVSLAPTANAQRAYMGQVSNSGNTKYVGLLDNNNLQVYWCFVTGGVLVAGEGAKTGFKGCSRSTSSNFILRTSQSNTTYSNPSLASGANSLTIFNHSLGYYIDATLSFYSFGSSIDLVKLEARVSALTTAFAAAIP